MRKMIMTIALALLLALPGGAPAQAQGTDGAGGFAQWVDGAVSSVESWAKGVGELEVSGQAVRRIAPDTASIQLGASIEKGSEKEAKDEADRIAQSIIAALKELGLEDRQMATSSYTVRSSGDSGWLVSAKKYVASVSLKVTVQDLDLVNTVIDTAVALGANTVGSIAFSHSRRNEIYREALSDAILAAQEKAQAMAQTAGVALETLLVLREGSASGIDTRYLNTAMSVGGAKESEGAQIMAGELEISATVTLIYQTR